MSVEKGIMTICALCNRPADTNRDLTLYSGHMDRSFSGGFQTTTFRNVQRHDLIICGACHRERLIVSLIVLAVILSSFGWWLWLALTQREFPGLQFLILIASSVIGLAIIAIQRRRYLAPVFRRIRNERGDHSLKVIDDTAYMSLQLLEATSPGRQK
jgi:hypothetical protein